MLVEHLYRNNMRYTHESFEFDRIINFMLGGYDEDLKGQFENHIYLTTKFYREFVKENPLSTKKEKATEKGKVFHATIFTGTFSGNCNAKDILSVSGLMVLDFDHLQNIEETRQILKDCLHTFVMFTSPSGTGLKCLVKHKLPIDKVATDWKPLFAEIHEYYLHLTKVSEESLDNSGSDVSRLCYLPYISENEFYRNDKCREWEYQGKFKINNRINDVEHFANVEHFEVAEYFEIEITEEKYLEWFGLSVYLAENSIDIANSYVDWIAIGFALATIGEYGRKIFHNVSCVSQKYNHNECDEQFDKCLEMLEEGRTNIYRYVNAAYKAIEEFNKKRYEKLY